MEFGLVAITCALFVINFSICKLSDRLEIIAKILLDDLDDSDEEEAE